MQGWGAALPPKHRMNRQLFSPRQNKSCGSYSLVRAPIHEKSLNRLIVQFVRFQSVRKLRRILEPALQAVNSIAQRQSHLKLSGRFDEACAEVTPITHQEIHVGGDRRRGTGAGGRALRVRKDDHFGVDIISHSNTGTFKCQQGIEKYYANAKSRLEP